MLGIGLFSTAASGKKWIRPCFGTISGFILGIVTLAIWIITYNWRPDMDYSWQLFPLLRTILEKNGFYQPESLPYGMWYWGAFSQWLLVGVSIDVVRWLIRFYQNSAKNRQTAWRSLAVIGVGWAVLMPLFLFWRECNDSELNHLQKLQGNLYYGSKPYNAAPPDETFPFSKHDLERNYAEIRSLVDMQDRRFKQFAVTIAASSIGLIILSAYVFRNAKRQTGQQGTPPWSPATLQQS